MGVPIIEEVLTFIHKVVDWFINLAPTWLKVVLGLFFVIFIANLIIPLFLGFFMGCTTTGGLYKMDTAIDGVNVMTYKLFSDLDSETTIDYTSVINRTEDEKSYTDWLVRFAPCYFGFNSSNCALGAFDYWRYQYPTNYSEESTTNYDGFIRSKGTLVDYENEVITPVCDGYNLKLYLFNRIDVFDPTLWLVITLLTILIPLAFRWYEITGIS